MSPSGGAAPRNPLLAAAQKAGFPVARLTIRRPGHRTIVVTKPLPSFSFGLLASVGTSVHDSRVAKSGSTRARAASASDLGISPNTSGCSRRTSQGDVRVNQDCGFQAQSEEDIAVNPMDSQNLIAADNSYEAGGDHMGAEWSVDRGRRWGALMPPWEFKLNDPAGQLPTASDPNRHTIYGDPGTSQPYFIASDPSVAFDSGGRAFLGIVLEGVTAEVGSGVFPSGLVVLSSPAGAKGSFYFPVEPIANSFPFALGDERPYTVAEDNTVRAVHDKPYVTADSYPSSPNRDNVYVTWTVILFDDQGNLREEPIFGSMSTDHGVTWSTPEEISGDSPQFCVGGDSFDPTLSPTACNFSQGSFPQVLPNGQLEVAFLNFNTPAADNQELAIQCHPTGSSPAGTAHMNCAAPTKIGDSVEGAKPRCSSRGVRFTCIPGSFVRTEDLPSLAVNRRNGHLYAAWQDYRSGEYDIQMASSTNAGSTWSTTTTVNPDHGLDHHEPAIALSDAGGRDRVGVSYYRTARVPGETPPGGGRATFTQGQPGVQNEPSDYVLSGGTGMAAPFRFAVVSPVFPPPDGVQGGFMGDYSALVVPEDEQAHPIWADTRNVDPFAPADGSTHDLDIFTTTFPLPDGVARQGTGTIGRSGGLEP